MEKISLIVPCYNEEKNIKIFFEETLASFKEVDIKLEIIFINDGSKDNSMNEFKKIINTKKCDIKVIDFSRNFGKEAGMYAGLSNCTGDYAVIIDADLQQHPRLVLPMLEEIKKDENIDIVAYYQEKRIENSFISLFKKIFYKIIDAFSDVKFVNGASDFRLFSRKVIDAILEIPEHDRFSKGIFSYVGFNTKYLPYVPEERRNGTSTWSIKSLFKYAISGILSFSKKPLLLPLYIGLFFNMVSTLYLITLLILYLFNLSFNSTFVIIGFLAYFSSFQFIFKGIIGEYLYRVYTETRNRPNYIIRDILINNKK